MTRHVLAICVLVAALLCAAEAGQGQEHKKHHKHHHHKHHKAAAAVQEAKNVTVANKTVVKAAPQKKPEVQVVKAAAAVAFSASKAAPAASSPQSEIMKKMKAIESSLSEKEQEQKAQKATGHIDVNGPVPVDFSERFVQAVAQATGGDPADVQVVKTNKDGDAVEVVFEGPGDIIKAVEDQAADPDSKIANGPLHEFLVADGSPAEAQEPDAVKAVGGNVHMMSSGASATTESDSDDAAEATPVEEKGIDVDTEMPYGELEPFGREDTAQELTEQSVHESDQMVDQLERAEVAEEKRAVFRALTRLRGAAITSFDGVARSQTGNIDEYNKTHKWRKTHPLHHLADEESDITKWAFPDNADF